jgi:hypothetical protein
MDRARARLPLIIILGIVTIAAASPATAAVTRSVAVGTLTSKTLVSTRTLRPGVVLLHYQARVSGLPTQQVYAVRWKLGNTHVRLRARMLGAYHSRTMAIDIHQISRYAHSTAPSRLPAMLNGDFFRYAGSGSSAITTSMFAADRRIYNFGRPKFGGGPAVGFSKSGNMVMGMPFGLPTRLLLPDGRSATVRTWNAVPPPTPTDQVAVFTHVGSSVPIPSGYSAVVVHDSPFRRAFVGTKHWVNQAGRGVNETVRSFYIHSSGTSATIETSPISTPPPGATSVTVPNRGSVLLFASTGVAGKGFLGLLGQTTPTVGITVNDPAWNDVTDIMGGKPQVVRHGVPLSTRPSYVTADQWSAEQWRPALATKNGYGMMIAIGASRGRISTTTPQFGHILAQLGVKDAMQFDNRSSTELFASTFSAGTCSTRFGACYTQYSRYERTIPVATGLYYTP